MTLQGFFLSSQLKLKNPKINIAIDGYSSSGKSTLAKALAKKLNYLYIDSGAMYRAITWFIIQNNIELNDKHLEKHLKGALIKLFSVDGKLKVSVNDLDISEDIRSMEISNMVSEVAAISCVRTYLVSIQQSYGKDKGVVMDGRDIGSVVFPDAELKFFMNADLATRSKRRLLELQHKGHTNLSETDVLKNLTHRDNIDSTRADSPLVQTSDAIVLDNSTISFDDLLEKAYEMALERIKLAN